MNWYKIFWWITVAERLQTFILTIAIASTIVMIFVIFGAIIAEGSIANLDEESKYNQDKIKRGQKWLAMFKVMNRITLPFFCVFWLLFIAIPSKNDTILIIAGGAVGNFVTSDSSSRAIPSEVTYFLREKIKAITAEAKSEMGILDEKGKRIKEFEKLTKEELIERLKTDTSLLK